MTRRLFILNSTPHNRAGVVTCGFPLERGELTTTSQLMVVDGANGIYSSNQSSFTQRVHWEPFGANYVNSDGSFNSYRYARIQLRAELDASSEKTATIRIADPGSSIYYTPVPYDNVNYNRFAGLTLTFRMNGNIATISASEMTLISSFGDATDQEYTPVKRYKIFKRPFASMPWIWMEFVIDIPSIGIYNSNGATVSTVPVEQANFWFRYGNSYIQRNLGTSEGTYARAQRQHYLTDFVTLTISGCDSLFRFENHIYGKNPLVPGNNTAGHVYTLEDPNYTPYPGNTNNNPDFYGTNRISASTCRNFRGLLFLAQNSSSTIQAEKYSHTGNGQPDGLKTSSEITAIAEGWGRFLPPNFLEADENPNTKSLTRSQKCALIDNMLFNRGSSNLSRQEPLPFPLGAYGLRAYAPGGGAQGTDGNAFHNYPLYYTVQASYSREVPYMIHAAESHGFRPLWMYEQDGTEWRYQNYPRSVIWWAQIHGTSQDFAGTYIPNFNSAGPHRNIWPEEWAGLDRQHCSIQLEMTVGIITADYYLSKFAESMCELYSASATIKSGNATVDGWEADRASGRIIQGLSGIHFLTGRMIALRALLTRAWMGVVLMWSWTNGSNYHGIETLKIIFTESGSVTNWSMGPVWSNNVYDSFPISSINSTNPSLCGGIGRTIWTNRRNNQVACDRLFHRPRNGWLYPITPRQTPFINPWQLSFVAVALEQAARACRQHFGPTGWSSSRYIVRDVASSTNDWIINGIITTTQPSAPLYPWSDYMDVNEDMFRLASRGLSNTVVNHCTFLFGPGSPYNWYNIAIQIQDGPVNQHQTLARVLECFRCGHVIEGVNSGATATIIAVEGGETDNQRVPGATTRFVNLWIKLISGTFSTNGPYLTENVRNQSNGYVSVNNGGFINNKWVGCGAFCIDRNGTAHQATHQAIPGTNPPQYMAGGEGYLKPHSQAQLEDLDSEKVWGHYSDKGPNWATPIRDYGEWQIACASVVIDGLRNNAYWTRDEVNYPVSNLTTKTKSMLSFVAAIASSVTSQYEMTYWPQMSTFSNFLDLGEVSFSAPMLGSLALTYPVTVSAQSNVSRYLEPKEIVAVTDKATATVTTTSATSVTINASLNAAYADIIDSSLYLGSSPSQNSAIIGSASLIEPIVFANSVTNRISRSVFIRPGMAGPSTSNQSSPEAGDLVLRQIGGQAIRRYELGYGTFPKDSPTSFGEDSMQYSSIRRLGEEPESSTDQDTPFLADETNVIIPKNLSVSTIQPSEE